MSAIQEDRTNNPLEDEIDLKELIVALWKGKVTIISVTTLFALSSIYISLSLTNIYTSESLLFSRDLDNKGSLSQLSGLASMAGFGSIEGQSDSFKVIEIIKSREFVKHLLTFEDVLPSLIAPMSYDKSTKKLSFDPEIYNETTKSWVREISDNTPAIPTYLEAHRAYSENLSVTQDKKTQFINIKFEHISPVFAQEFLTIIIREANNLNREFDIEMSNKALNYLSTELSRTTLLEIKNSISELIQAQLETKMMASIYDEYSLVTLEPPFIPDRKSSPIRSLIVIFSTLVGGLLSVFYVLVRHYTVDKKEQS